MCGPFRISCSETAFGVVSGRADQLQEQVAHFVFLDFENPFHFFASFVFARFEPLVSS